MNRQESSNQTRAAVIAHGLVVAVFFLVEEYVRIFTRVPSICKMMPKLLTSGSIALLGLRGYLKRRRPGDGFLVAGLFACVPADMVINRHSLAGIALFIVAQALFCMGLVRQYRPQRWQLGVWLAGCAVAAAALVAAREVVGSLAAPVMAYAALLLGTVTLALRARPQLRAGVATFAVSDVMLAVNYVLGQPNLGSFILLAVYYAGVLIIAASLWPERDAVV